MNLSKPINQLRTFIFVTKGTQFYYSISVFSLLLTHAHTHVTTISTTLAREDPQEGSFYNLESEHDQPHPFLSPRVDLIIPNVIPSVALRTTL